MQDDPDPPAPPPPTPGAAIEPGHWVRHPAQPDWGVGQVQSAVGDRITVNFEHAGKVLVNAAQVTLDLLDGPPDA
jgi:hypothetical protein